MLSGWLSTISEADDLWVTFSLPRCLHLSPNESESPYLGSWSDVVMREIDEL
jgi:hypothetical protein